MGSVQDQIMKKSDFKSLLSKEERTILYEERT